MLHVDRIFQCFLRVTSIGTTRCQLRGSKNVPEKAPRLRDCLHLDLDDPTSPKLLPTVQLFHGTGNASSTRPARFHRLKCHDIQHGDLSDRGAFHRAFIPLPHALTRVPVLWLGLGRTERRAERRAKTDIKGCTEQFSIVIAQHRASLCASAVNHDFLEA